MCEFAEKPVDAEMARMSVEAARSLAKLMERQLGYLDGHIDPIALRLFIRAYWSRVSKYAHIIHEEPT